MGKPSVNANEKGLRGIMRRPIIFLFHQEKCSLALNTRQIS